MALTTQRPTKCTLIHINSSLCINCYLPIEQHYYDAIYCSHQCRFGDCIGVICTFQPTIPQYVTIYDKGIRYWIWLIKQLLIYGKGKS
jgi:hypothetical protein